MEDEIKFKLGPMGILGVVYLALGFVFALIVASLAIFASIDNQIPLIILGFMGAVWLLLGFIFLQITVSDYKKIKRVVAEGRKVFCDFVSVKLNYYVKVNNRRPYNVYCKWIDDQGNEHTFKSGNVFFDPTESLMGKKIPVYVDVDNYKLYYVDLECVLPVQRSHHNHIV